MKRKAMEIDKSKIERARDGKGGAGGFVPSGGISSGGMGGGGRGIDLDSTPTFSRCAPRPAPGSATNPEPVYEKSQWAAAGAASTLTPCPRSRGAPLARPQGLHEP